MNKEIDKQIQDLENQIRELKKKKDYLSQCEHIRAFLEFMEQGFIRLEFYASMSSTHDFKCIKCKQSIPEELIRIFTDEN